MYVQEEINFLLENYKIIDVKELESHNLYLEKESNLEILISSFENIFSSRCVNEKNVTFMLQQFYKIYEKEYKEIPFTGLFTEWHYNKKRAVIRKIINRTFKPMK